MTAPTTLVWDLAGRPEPAASLQSLLKPGRAVCAVSGDDVELSADANKALGTSFTDRTMFRAPASDRVGAGALWCCSGKGMSTIRLWSAIAAPGESLQPSHEKAWIAGRPGLWLGNRADPAPIARILADPPDREWLVSVAVSAQKHVLPYATVNHGRGRWVVRMETTDITCTPPEWSRLHEAATELRRMGVPADHVLAGTPGFIRNRADLQRWREYAEPLTPYTLSPVLGLALWTITKGTLGNA